MPGELLDAAVAQLTVFPNVPQHQTAAAHVAAAGEVRREQQRHQNPEERLDVLAARDASQQHELRSGGYGAGQPSRVLLERPAIARLSGIDVHTGEALEALASHGRLGRQQSLVRRDDPDPGNSRGRRGEGPRVRDLPAEVEAGEKGEDLRERRARARAQPAGEIEARLGPQEDSGSFAREAGRGEQEDPGRREGSFRLRQKLQISRPANRTPGAGST